MFAKIYRGHYLKTFSENLLLGVSLCNCNWSFFDLLVFPLKSKTK